MEAPGKAPAGGPKENSWGAPGEAPREALVETPGATPGQKAPEEASGAAPGKAPRVALAEIPAGAPRQGCSWGISWGASGKALGETLRRRMAGCRAIQFTILCIKMARATHGLALVHGAHQIILTYLRTYRTFSIATKLHETNQKLRVAAWPQALQFP